MIITDIQHELLYDHDNIVISLPKSERAHIIEYLQGLKVREGKEYDIKITQHREKRSLNANAYYHVIIRKIASVLGSSVQEIHNDELCKYGQLAVDKDGSPKYLLCKASIDFRKEEHIHLQPTGKTEDRNGTLYAWYRELKPSHEYNTKEMSDLLDGALSDAKDLGIEVATPDEIARMKAMGVE